MADNDFTYRQEDAEKRRRRREAERKRRLRHAREEYIKKKNQLRQEKNNENGQWAGSRFYLNGFFESILICPSGRRGRELDG